LHLWGEEVAFLWSDFKSGHCADVEKLALERQACGTCQLLANERAEHFEGGGGVKRSTGRFRQDVAEAWRTASSHTSRNMERRRFGTPAGSLRRGKGTVGDLDLLLTLAVFHGAEDIDAIAEHILK